MRNRIARIDEPARSRAGFSLALLLACATPVFAQLAFGQVSATSEYLARMDTDANGSVSLLEYQDWLSYAFDAMDVDHDGILAPAEQPGGRGKPLTREEHRARLAERFRKQDANRDGVLSAKELAAPPR